MPLSRCPLTAATLVTVAGLALTGCTYDRCFGDESWFSGGVTYVPVPVSPDNLRTIPVPQGGGSVIDPNTLPRF